MNGYREVRFGAGEKAMKKNLDVLWLVIAGIVVLAMSVIGARAQEQTRFYGPDGRALARPRLMATAASDSMTQVAEP
jgi:hypothetical protein